VQRAGTTAKNDEATSLTLGTTGSGIGHASHQLSVERVAHWQRTDKKWLPAPTEPSRASDLESVDDSHEHIDLYGQRSLSLKSA